MRSSLVLAAMLLAGCPTSGGECTVDTDCLSGDVCANTHVCLAPGAVQYLSIRWTIDGAAPTDATCAPYDPLIVTVADSETADYHTSWDPVPCAPGRFTLDKLPVEYDEAALTIRASGAEQRALIPAGGGDLFFDLAASLAAN